MTGGRPHRWRVIAVSAAVLCALFLLAAWIILLRSPGRLPFTAYAPRDGSPGVMAYLANADAKDPTTPRVIFNGDRIVAVDGVPATDGERFVRELWRPRPVGESVLFQVERASTPDAPSRTEEVRAILGRPLGHTGWLLLLSAFSQFAVLMLCIATFVILARPEEPARLTLLVWAITAAVQAIALVLIGPNWPWSIWAMRASLVANAASAFCLLHLFLIFPATHPVLARLRRLRVPGLSLTGVSLLYLPAVLTLAIVLALPLGTWDAVRLFGVVANLATLTVQVQNFRRPPTPLARPQLGWILWGTGLTTAAQAAAVTIGLRTGSTASMEFLAGVLVTANIQPVVLSFAILRYRLFDVGEVVRATTTYALLGAFLVGGYLLVSFVASRIVLALAGAAAAENPTIQVLAALAMAAAAQPFRQRLQGALDRLVYRARLARRRFLEEAAVLFERAQPPETVASFLTRGAEERLALTGAWLALAPEVERALAGAAPLVPPSGASAGALVQRLAGATRPVTLTDDRLEGSPVDVLPPDDPTLRPWYDAGARLLVPLRADAEGAPIGVWVLGALRSGDLPSREDVVAAGRVAGQAGVMFEYARLGQEHAQQQIVRFELQQAQQIQRLLLPDALPAWPDVLELAHRFRPARETSGDFYDATPIHNGQDGNGAGGAAGRTVNGVVQAPLQITVGDVAGKGIGAALVMSRAQALLRLLARNGAPGAAGAALHDAPAAAMLDVLGAALHRDLGPRHFVACSLVVVSENGEGPGGPGGHGVRAAVANAAQVPPLLCRAGEVSEVEPPGDRFPLGVMPRPTYGEAVLALQPGDVLVLTSDGLPEAPARAALPVVVAAGAALSAVPADSGAGDAPQPRFPQPAPGELFGFERLAASAGYWSAHGTSADAIAAGIWSDVTGWCGESQHDDMTLVVLRVAPAGALN